MYSSTFLSRSEIFFRLFLLSGYKNVSNNPHLAYRSENFPGLAFLLPTRVFDQHLNHSFPSCCSKPWVFLQKKKKQKNINRLKLGSLLLLLIGNPYLSHHSLLKTQRKWELLILVVTKVVPPVRDVPLGVSRGCVTWGDVIRKTAVYQS